MKLKETNTKNKFFWIKVVIILIIIIGLIISYFYFNITSKINELLNFIEKTGLIGVIIYIVIYIIACVLLIPGSIITLAGGVLFGVVKGSIIVSLSSTIGATLSFIFGRTFAGNLLRKKMENNTTFLKLDSALKNEGSKIVFLTRLSPIFPFNLLNYVFGLTKIKLSDYILFSWIGMMPGTILYVYSGSVIGDLALLNQEGRSKTQLELILYGVGLIATIIVTVIIIRLAKKALSKKIG